MKSWSMGMCCKVRAYFLLLVSCALAGQALAAEAEESTVTFRVVAVNPAVAKTQQTQVKFYLPQEITPRDVVDVGGLDLEYDDQKATYFVFKRNVELAPRETRVFDVVVQDVWMVPGHQLKELDEYTALLMSRLEKTTYAQTAQTIANSIHERLATITTVQSDQALSRRQHIGSYRTHLQTLAQVKEDLARMEKLLTFTGGPPVPEMLKESPLKSDAPSTKTTWMIIFMIMVFLGLLGGLFFITWHRKAVEGQDFFHFKESSFPSSGDVAPDSSPKGKAA